MKTSRTTKTKKKINKDLLPPLGICAIFKNETLYLKEWIEFHRLVGVSKFFLYNNESTDDYLEILQPYIDLNIVNLKDWPVKSPCQLSAYQDLIERASKQKVWIAFIDVDEFLFSPKHDNVAEILAQQEEACGIGVNWMCFGSSGLMNYEPIPVIERFTWRPKYDHCANIHIKSIIRLDQDVCVGDDPHFFLCQHMTFNENGDLLIGPYNLPSTNLLRINHYATKSRNEWYERGMKGKADIPDYKIDWKKFDLIEDRDVQDFDIQRFLPELKKRLESKTIIV